MNSTGRAREPGAITNISVQSITAKMSKSDLFREFISEILSTAALEIFGGVEKTLAEYKEEISRSEEERKRLQRLLDVVTQPEIKLHRTEVQQLSLPEPPQIKEEQELWTSQEEELLQGLQSETTGSILISSSVEHDSDQEGSSECSHLVQIVKVEDRGDPLPTNTTEEQIKAEPRVQDSAAPELGSDSQPLSVVAPDCPAAQSLEEHGRVMLLQNRTQNNEALPRDNRPQGSHTRKTIHQCQQCNRTFISESHLIKHMRTHTGERPFHCQQCNKQFAQKCHLVDHMRTHTGEKPFQCQQCNKTFSQKSSLVDHRRTHTGEKPYQCQHCSKRFAYKCNLVGHTRTHTGERPFRCQQCNKTFRQQSALVDHMRMHTGEKPYRCRECNESFMRRPQFLVHVRKHTGEQPFQCQECNRTFIWKYLLVRHMMRTSECQECNNTFCKKSDFDDHMRTHTGQLSY
ncbi:zinc finger protein 391-like [Osmerus eperlanus]|uniref:zinc finger protein 391-like n=1 Tax=Osmerus eperlanus TaxID=29151 RepID=UPI002E12F778